MTSNLRPLTPRPTVLVGGRASVADTSSSRVGTSGPLGRARMVTALPTNGTGPVKLVPPVVVQGGLGYVGDPSGNVIGGSSAVWVHRIVSAAKAPETRRLG